MAFPEKLLAPDEHVVVEACPNWSVIARPVVLAFALWAGCVALVVEWPSAPVAVAYVVAAVMLLALAWLMARVAGWRARLLVITTNRVIYRFGVLHRTGREIPLRRVQDVSYHQTILERLVGAGSLMIESAGANGSAPFPDVRHPAEMQSLINRLIAGEYRPVPSEWDVPAGTAGDPPTSELPVVVAPPPGGGVLREQLLHLERLHELGVLSDGEFDDKRRSLLGVD